MTDDEARAALDIPCNATMAEIKAAFYAKAKQYHPDRNAGPGAEAEFQRVEQAYRTLIGRKPANPSALDRSQQDGDSGARRARAAAGADALDLITLVRSVLAMLGVTILFDGTIRVGLGSQEGYGPNDAAAWLARTPDWGFEQLLDEVMIALRRDGTTLSVGEVKRALSKIVREDQQDRSNFIMRPLLFDPLDDEEQVRARAAWASLVGPVFEGDTALVTAVLQHFVWQVKRKQLERPVEHHLTPIVVSSRQGTGKSTFVRRFVGPLQDLASPPVLLSDLADRRSGDIFRFPATFADDIERLDPRLVPALKSVLTSGALSRRRLGTSIAVKRPQITTVIGTANESVGTMIPDATGHRRFAELAFRNGNVDREGDPEVWLAIEEADYDLLWRSVDGHAPSPILPFLKMLGTVQDAAAPPDILKCWLYKLDPSSDEVEQITVPGPRKVGADDLRLLFCAQTGEEISNNRFEARMAVLVGDPQVPFRTKRRVAAGCFYPFKPRTADG
ncbi:hypothetical protein ASG51_22405 [Methylobacterium sp. Leaf465]|uniref:DnaJ domain-containing protein n=1 Tax=Methylobacterium sp. Leaf465 TaxID=1736385 RepID=UPI0006F83014|nr:DnaJ domain-containing protein [Methylobacterium sp. Leaf465]KQT77461.1 hypothetical protein ASG51_22405 [Methylobacterium sp. Leaf465]